MDRFHGFLKKRVCFCIAKYSEYNNFLPARSKVHHTPARYFRTNADKCSRSLFASSVKTNCILTVAKDRWIATTGSDDHALTLTLPTQQIRKLSASVEESHPDASTYLDTRDAEVEKILGSDMRVFLNFLSEEEEQSLYEEVESYMKRLRYEYDHWDNAIHGYRETEKRNWNPSNQIILKRVQDLAFHAGVAPLAYVHVLDIAKSGYIKPHVDAIRFCGDTIAGLSLLSPCVMRLAMESDKERYGDVHLPARSLYIMQNRARYDFTHEVLKESESFFRNDPVPRDRRISVICRNEPNPADKT